MTRCLRCQARDVAVVLGREAELFEHYEGEIDRLQSVIDRRVREAVLSIERDHERTVEILNKRIAGLNAEVAAMKKAS